MAVEYPGYGVYDGTPTPEQIAQDSTDVYDYLTRDMGLNEDQIIVFGRSIGSGPACQIAS